MHAVRAGAQAAVAAVGKLHHVVAQHIAAAVEEVVVVRFHPVDDAVVHLGVGKNMVASIRFWLKAVGLLQDNELNPIADYLFNDENGQDPYIEDIGTLWLLHFMLVNTQYATIYKTTFVDYHRQRNIIEKGRLQNYIDRKSVV